MNKLFAGLIAGLLAASVSAMPWNTAPPLPPPGSLVPLCWTFQPPTKRTDGSRYRSGLETDHFNIRAGFYAKEIRPRSFGHCIDAIVLKNGKLPRVCPEFSTTDKQGLTSHWSGKVCKGG